MTRPAGPGSGRVAAKGRPGDVVHGVFAARDLGFRYPGAARDTLRDVTMEVPAGALYAVLGPNSAGKSTLLRLLLGLEPPERGEVLYRGQPTAGWGRRAIAREVGVVPQSEEIAFPMTVRELVSMGRYPHLGPWRREGPEDRRAVDAALARCDVADLASRPLSTLSGGERQRARVARALAQEPSTLVLDEPTASLDIRHEMAIFRLLRALADDGTTVLVVTHNLNLAARFADHLLLLGAGQPAASGPPGAVLRPDIVGQVYGWPVDVHPLAGAGADAGAPQIVPRTDSTISEVATHPQEGKLE